MVITKGRGIQWDIFLKITSGYANLTVINNYDLDQE